MNFLNEYIFFLHQIIKKEKDRDRLCVCDGEWVCECACDYERMYVKTSVFNKKKLDKNGLKM